MAKSPDRTLETSEVNDSQEGIGIGIGNAVKSHRNSRASWESQARALLKATDLDGAMKLQKKLRLLLDLTNERVEKMVEHKIDGNRMVKCKCGSGFDTAGKNGGNCMRCEELGRDSVELCIQCSGSCYECSDLKWLCAEHSGVCWTCSKRFCDNCSAKCDRCNKNTCVHCIVIFHVGNTCKTCIHNVG
mmetsp:Transcript_44199/g.86738  ORF Transcript_44199/g.86738 Transcript_44199/m.86738 type:complete len:188 (+) Transcript_44199:123-686(+)